VTREERETTVRRIVQDPALSWQEQVKKIVDAWEDDSDEAFQRGVWAGQASRGAEG
jgi:hypothetical protein